MPRLQHVVSRRFPSAGVLKDGGKLRPTKRMNESFCTEPAIVSYRGICVPFVFSGSKNDKNMRSCSHLLFVLFILLSKWAQLETFASSNGMPRATIRENASHCPSAVLKGQKTRACCVSNLRTDTWYEPELFVFV